jgi:uncharacterized protein YraI
MKHRSFLAILIFCTILLLAVGCNQSEDPTPTATLVPTNTPIPAPDAPLPTSTPLPTNIPPAAETPIPTATFPPTATPAAVVVVYVVNAATNETVPNAEVRLTQSDLGYNATFTTRADGRAVFGGVEVSPVPYTVQTLAVGFRPTTGEVVIEQRTVEVPIQLQSGAWAIVNTELANLRSGPGYEFDIIAEISQGTAMPVLGVSDDKEWVRVRTEDGLEGWLFADLVTIEGDAGQIVGGVTPPQPVPTVGGTPIPGVTPPPAGAPVPPTGPNLLLNPGFEDGSTAWQSAGGGEVTTYTTTDYPNFVLSGNRSAYMTQSNVYHQPIEGLTAGATYRVTAWGKTWSSSGEDRTTSENPGTINIRVCINTNADDNPAESICSARAQPLDTWQPFSVDVVATQERLSVLLVAEITEGGPVHSEALWDDIALGLSPIPGTPTPTPEGGEAIPSRPAPVPFDGQALLASMRSLQNTFEQMGGVLDRFIRGEDATCAEYQGYFERVIASPTYSGVPEDWLGTYGLYNDAVDKTLDTNKDLYLTCVENGVLSGFNFTVARQGINDSVDLIHEAITNAETLLLGS